MRWLVVSAAVVTAPELNRKVCGRPVTDPAVAEALWILLALLGLLLLWLLVLLAARLLEAVGVVDAVVVLDFVGLLDRDPPLSLDSILPVAAAAATVRGFDVTGEFRTLARPRSGYWSSAAVGALVAVLGGDEAVGERARCCDNFPGESDFPRAFCVPVDVIEAAVELGNELRLIVLMDRSLSPLPWVTPLLPLLLPVVPLLLCSILRNDPSLVDGRMRSGLLRFKLDLVGRDRRSYTEAAAVARSRS